ncbi:unnamed protein product [Durusdinium trenchii]|uniref:PLOD1-3-like GT domain-containing protein n=1 Tax=Durusdinium trenchii TaxID=1381693 RepID=A0ABP0IVV4_9DINO
MLQAPWVQVASVGFPSFGQKALAGIRSALFFASRPLRFHLVVDALGQRDVQRALDSLEPWLREKGSFRFYQQEGLQDAWREIHALVPEDCLQFSGHYGSAGWLRMFPHLVVPSSEADDALIWVDAGDFVFLADPAELAQHVENFDEDDFMAVADDQVLALPMQVFSLKRLRSARRSSWRSWAELVTDAVHRGYAEQGRSFCGLGEGLGMVWLLHHAQNRWIYHEIPHHWTYMPWAVWLPSTGTGSLWASSDTLWRLPADPVWSDSVFPGLSDFTTLRVKCPSYLEDLAGYIRVALDADPEMLNLTGSFADPKPAVDIFRKHFRLTRDAQIVDEFAQRVGCEDRIKAVHLPVMFHEVPWVHRFLDFWAGAEVWSAGSSRLRELRTERAEMLLSVMNQNSALSVMNPSFECPQDDNSLTIHGDHGVCCFLLAATGLQTCKGTVMEQNEEAEDFLRDAWERQFRKKPPAPGRVTVVTVDTNKPRRFIMLGAGRLPVINAGFGEDWFSWRDKPRLYHKFLNAFAAKHPERFVALVDGFDTIFGGCSEEELLSAFNMTVSASDASVVWGAENCCFPWRDSCLGSKTLAPQRWSVLKQFGLKEGYEGLGDCRRCRDLDIPGYDSFCSAPPAYEHLNSGFLMGLAKDVSHVVEQWLKLYWNNSETDQLVARTTFLQTQQVTKMTLDYSGSLVLTVGNIPETAIAEVFSIQENVIRNHRTGAVQCFIHGAGPGKVFLAHLLQQLATSQRDRLGKRELELSIKECSASLELGSSASVLRKRAEKYRKLGQYEKAIQDFTGSLKLEDNALALAGRGAAFRSLGRLPEAIGDFNMAAHLEPDNIQVYMGRAQVLREQGQVMQASATSESNMY